MDPRTWVIKRVLPVSVLVATGALILIIVFPELFLSTTGVLLLVISFAFAVASAILWPYVLRERRKNEIDDELHLFIIRIAVMSLAASTRSSIFEMASKEGGSRAIMKELNKVKDLKNVWNISLPQALRTVSRQTPSRRLGDFLERMAYAIETDEDPKVFFRNEQEAVMEEYRSRYATTLDRMEVVREVYISMISVTMFLNVMLVIMTIMVGINHYLMSFLIVFIFIVVELALWVTVNGVLPREHIWYDPKPHPIGSKFHRWLNLWLWSGIAMSALIAAVIPLFGLRLEFILLYFAGVTTPLLMPGIVIVLEERQITRRDEAFGAFIRTIGSTSESKGGAPSAGLKRIRWHDFGPLTGQVRDLYDRLKLRVDSDKAWALFIKGSRSELISQFLNTYQEGISAGGSPKHVSSLISGNFSSISSLRKRRYLMANNFAAILYSLTMFISAGLFMTYGVVREILDRLAGLETTSQQIERLQDLVLLKNVEGLETLMFVSILCVVALHVMFSADAIRRFKGSHPMMVLVHLPMLLWTAAVSGWLALYAVTAII